MIRNPLQAGWPKASLVMLTCLACYAYGQTQEPPRHRLQDAGRTLGTPGTLTIGAVLPLTVQYAEYGENVLGALEAAAEDINRRGSLRLRVIAADDKGDPGQAASAIQKLIKADRARFVIGGFTSSCSEAMYPIAEWNGVLLF